MEKIFEEGEEPKKKVLKDILKEEGRSQVWLGKQLEEYGVSRDQSQISMYCTGKYQPKDIYILRVIAQILGREEEEIINCFK